MTSYLTIRFIEFGVFWRQYSCRIQYPLLCLALGSLAKKCNILIKVVDNIKSVEYLLLMYTFLETFFFLLSYQISSFSHDPKE